MKDIIPSAIHSELFIEGLLRTRHHSKPQGSMHPFPHGAGILVEKTHAEQGNKYRCLPVGLCAMQNENWKVGGMALESLVRAASLRR